MIPRFCLSLCALFMASCASDYVADTLSVDASRSTLTEHANSQAQSIMPKRWDLTNVFDVYSKNGDKRIGAAWARNWTRNVDLTGVAWDTAQNGTLISPRHVLMARHAPREIGSELLFHDDNGNLHKRVLIGAKAVDGAAYPDIMVGLLDEPVPVKHYKLLPPQQSYSDLVGATVLLTNCRHNLLVAKVGKLGRGGVAFSHDEHLPAYLQQKLRDGDSGNPTFLLVEGEPVLVSTHSKGGAGSGPFFSYPKNYYAIEQAMKELGGGYKLETIALAGATPVGPPKVRVLPAPSAARVAGSHTGHSHGGHSHSGHSHGSHSHGSHSHGGHSHAGHDHGAHATPPAPATSPAKSETVAQAAEATSPATPQPTTAGSTEAPKNFDASAAFSGMKYQPSTPEASAAR